MKFFTKLIFVFFIGISILSSASAQENNSVDSSSKFKLISPGPQYKRSHWHNLFWGKNYRTEWSTPVPLPEFYLNERNGGLIPDKLGGGHQTSSLHLTTKDDKNYTLRSVDKRLGKVLPESFKGTWIERQVNDEVSMSNPYGAMMIPLMSQSAGIYHTNPEIFYLPKQAALDSFDDEVGNKVYLFEQRLKGDWHEAANLGSFDKFYKTEEVMQKMEENPENRADQKTFLKDRLFDMFIGDWDRHQDQWAWGEVKKGDSKIYVPVPEDRDQAFSKHGGLILCAAMSGAGIKYMQSFSGKIKNVNTFNFEERGIDRFFLNELIKQDWDSIAKNLQLSLTDSVIDAAVHQLPAKIFAISGKKIIADLKSRREQIPAYADQYYLFLNKEVEIIGTKGRDYFNVKRINNDETALQVYNIAKDGVKSDSPYYSRVFQNNETKEIRLFGLSGNDVYNTEGKVSSGMKIRIIGGPDRDSILLQSLVGNKTRTFIYDDKNNYLHADGSVRKKYSSDSAVHRFDSMSYVYDKKGVSPTFFYSDADRFYVGLNYKWEHHAWRKTPYVFKQDIGVNYSISQHALSFTYFGIFPNTIGKWNLNLLANYDAVRWTNFYGLGNETILTTKNTDFNRMRTREVLGGIGLNRTAGNNRFELGGFYNTVKIINDDARYIALKVQPNDLTVFDQKNFAGANAIYTFSKLNDVISPTAGITFSANGSYTQNTSNSNQSFWKYGGNLQLYIPLFYKFSIATSGGIETVDGNPEFYQYPEIGGGQDLRGFQRQRFYGKTAFYNSNELRFISNVKNYLYSGKAGLLVFVDDGRVWLPGEMSNTLHVGYGAGIFLAPFNKVSADITYGFSKEDKLLQFRFNLKL
ncbi:MAG: BamA/TamA family outer membrane protein [Ginsengibacter sp.]